jgi:hypothetical protein
MEKGAGVFRHDGWRALKRVSASDRAQARRWAGRTSAELRACALLFSHSIVSLICVEIKHMFRLNHYAKRSIDALRDASLAISTAKIWTKHKEMNEMRMQGFSPAAGKASEFEQSMNRLALQRNILFSVRLVHLFP